MEKGPKSPPPSKDDIISHLEHMLASPDFPATPRQTALLKYIVRQTLEGKSRDIAEESIAAAVFDRGADFEPITDPIVSINIDILRRVLERYYRTTGKNDPIRVDIPPDTCVPVFRKR